jgi:acyl-CoA reductase-like NAD-dependent aldehyde dehydrogenase
MLALLACRVLSSLKSWSRRANHNKSQIIYYFGENFSARSNELVSKLELLTNKPRDLCKREVELCSSVIFHFASLCDKHTGRTNVS